MEHGLPIKWTTSSLLASTLITIALGGVLYHWSSKSPPLQETSEPGLFKNHSSYETLTTPSGHVYPKIRVVYHPHPQATKLPKDIPLLVFMHGLGGNATQFAPLLTSLVKVAPCLLIDLPGCGLSDFKPNDVSAYTTGAFAELLFSAVDKYRDADNDQKVVLIGHSMGASICALLASSASPLGSLLDGVLVGFVAICPRSNSPSSKETSMVQRLKWMPTLVFDILRALDRRGGMNSPSVTRAVGDGADEETRKLQVRYNRQSKSAVFLRMIIAALPPTEESNLRSSIGWPGEAVWSGIKIPLFLIAGESDHLTPPKEIEQIRRWLSPHDSDIVQASGNESNGHSLALESKLFPAPAAHGLMYAPSTAGILGGLLESFFSQHLDPRLDRGWQKEHIAIYN